MDRSRRIELVQRSLGIRHKLKVHESVRPADNHEDMASNYSRVGSLRTNSKQLKSSLRQIAWPSSRKSASRSTKKALPSRKRSSAEMSASSEFRKFLVGIRLGVLSTFVCAASSGLAGATTLHTNAVVFENAPSWLSERRIDKIVDRIESHLDGIFGVFRPAA